MDTQHFTYDPTRPPQALPKWAGLFVSRGGGKHPDRRLPSYEIMFLRSGVLEMQEDDQKFTIKAGETLLLWPERRHRGLSERSAGLEMFWVHFTWNPPPAANGDNDAQLLQVPQHAVVANPQFLESLFRHYLEEQDARRLDPMTADLLVSLMLCEIARPPLDADMASAAAILAGRADLYIRTHFHEPLTTSQIAKEIPCNPSYLSRVYRQCHGRTVTEAISFHRLDHAKHLLVDTNQSVGEIARACGIEDASYFLKLFKRATGTTALTFRRRHMIKTINTR